MARILRGLLLWLAAAFVLLTAASFLLSRTGASSEVLGYVSSGISFLCAVAAGTEAAGGRGDRPLLHGLTTALVIIILLLTVGFLAKGTKMNPSGILSVVSFTITGVLLGFVLVRYARRGRIRRGRSRKAFKMKS